MEFLKRTKQNSETHVMHKALKNGARTERESQR